MKLLQWVVLREYTMRLRFCQNALAASRHCRAIGVI